jgi:S-(hydroxymethyl)glutathione dehydrogenase/alcohol dehydrogenase
MKIRAAVLNAPREPLEVADLELSDPGPDEVRVKIEASGICRSDLSYIHGKWPIPTPVVLGHEGAGVIESVGPGVPTCRIGEHVVLTFAPACGQCRFCLDGRANLCEDAAAGLDSGFMRDGSSRLSRGTATVRHLAYVSSFASHAVVPANGAVAVDARVEPSLACLLGCGVTTGVLAVTRRANVRPGDSVAVFACGGVGLSAVMGARLVAASPIIAIDPVREKRELALTFGATHSVDPAGGDVVEQIRAIAPGGVDFSFEALGRAEVIDQAFRSVRHGGVAVLIGQPEMGVKAGIDVYDATQFEQTILGTNMGGAVPALHIPVLARLVAGGALNLRPLVTHSFPLDRINEAVEMTASGAAGRVVILP